MKEYTAKRLALRIVLLIWPLYIISEAWIRGQLWRLIAGLVLLALIAWWAVSYTLHLRRQEQEKAAQAKAAAARAEEQAAAKAQEEAEAAASGF